MPKSRTSSRDAGLIPVRKRTAAGHEQVYWVRPEDLRPKVQVAMKAAKKGGDSSWGFTEEAIGSWKALVSEFGGDGARAEVLLDAWSHSSTHPKAIGLRGAAVALVTEDAAERARMLAEDADDVVTLQTQMSAERRREALDKVTKPGSSQLDRMIADKVQDHEESANASMQEGLEKDASTLAALSALSQSMYDTPEVTVYRGIFGKQAEEVQRRLDAGDTEVTLDVGSVTSFSERRAQAAKFARGGGLLIQQAVPRSSIAFSHRAIPHLDPKRVLGGQEVAVLTKGSMRISRADIHAGF